MGDNDWLQYYKENKRIVFLEQRVWIKNTFYEAVVFHECTRDWIN